MLAENNENANRQLAVIGAGKGKSRIATAIAWYFLKATKEKVYILFSDIGL